MTRLGENRYGKSRVRLSRITRRPDGRHDFDEWTVRVLLEGDFSASFTEADNSNVLPTDTMKNTVYYVARSSAAACIEGFAIELGDHLLSSHRHIARATVEIAAHAWERMIIEGKPEETTFKLRGPELQTATVQRMRGCDWEIASGVDNLTLLKTTKSAFTGYIQDKLTTLKPATDRIFGTSATARWSCTALPADHTAVRARVLTALERTFAEHDSMSVQHTLFDMGKAALDAAPELARITLTMPNLHHLLADLTPFGLDNPNHIFVPIDEPHGYIEATVER